MKNLIVFFICSSLCLAGFSQNNCINSFVDKYKTQDEVTHLNISGNLLSFMSHNEDRSEKYRTTLNSLEVLSIDEHVHVRASDIQALRQGIQANDYEELIRVRDKKELIHVFITEDTPGIINELIIMVEAPDNFTLVSLSGEIHYEDLQDLNFDGDAGAALNKLPSRVEERP